MKKQRTCGGKRRFRDRQEALRSVRHAAFVSTREKVPTRAYECPNCNGWHVTSKANRY